MKNLLVFIVITSILITGCRKEKDPEPEPEPQSPVYWGEAYFHLGIIKVDAKTYSTSLEADSTVSVFVDLFDAQKIRTGRLSFHYIPKRTGALSLKRVKYPTDGSPDAIFFEMGEDVIRGEYNIVEENTVNDLNITTFDEDLGKITGTFNVTLVVDSTFKILVPTLADTLRFTDGYFDTKIYKY